MTKKHFIALAKSLKYMKPRETDLERMDQWVLIVAELADFCKEQNRNFDRYRWLGYINGENGPSGGAIKHG